MIVFPTESGKLLRKIVRADDACLFFKPKSCFSDEWKRETVFPEIGGVKSLVVFLVMWGLFFKIVPKRIWHKKTAFLQPRISVPRFREKPKNRSNGPPFRQKMPREVQPTSRGLSFPHKLPQNRRLTAFHPAVLSVLQRKQKPLKKPKILRKSSTLFSAFQDLSPTPSLALRMQKIRVL